MCSLVLLRRPGDAWPLVIAANRDEMRDRPSRPPGRHWPDRPEVVGGLDLLAGGSWLAVSDRGMVAAVLNRRGSLGPAAGKRSRGELVLEALDHADPDAAAHALLDLDPAAYRPFNLVIADRERAFWLRHAGGGRITRHPLAEGVRMLTSTELDDPACPRIRRYRPLFARALPADGDWSDWQLLLGSTASETGDPRHAMCIRTDTGYGTVSASILALPADPTAAPVWLYADGPPDEAPFLPVSRASASP